MGNSTDYKKFSFWLCEYFFLLNTLFWRHYLMYQTLNSFFLYVFVVNCQFFQITPSEYAYNAEKWHALSHEQYFSKHSFLEICRCAFNWLLKHIEKIRISQDCSLIDSCTELSFSLLISRSSRPVVFCKKGVLGNFTKFTGTHLC